jgi:hypothetical protein
MIINIKLNFIYFSISNIIQKIVENMILYLILLINLRISLILLYKKWSLNLNI